MVVVVCRDGVTMPRRPLMVRAALLRRSCDGVAAATELRRPAPSCSFCASRLSDATRRMSATELVCAATPSQQHYNLALNWSSSSRPSSRCCQQHLEEGRGGTSRRDASCAQHQRRRSSISAVAAASAPSQQQKQATAVSRDDERSTGALLLKLFRDGDIHAKRRVITSLSSKFTNERAGCHLPCDNFFFR